MNNLWTNKIVAHADVDPRDLTSHALNWRKHPQAQRQALGGAISEVGFIRSVTVNRRTGNIIDGHLRVEEAIRSGQPTIPVEYVDLTEDEEREALATIDPLAAMAEADSERLDALLREVSSGDPAITQMLADLAGVDADEQGEPVDPADLWNGMPEFEQEERTTFKTLHVHFETRDDYMAFAQLVDQALTEDTRSIWYPYREKFRHLDYVADDES